MHDTNLMVVTDVSDAHQAASNMHKTLTGVLPEDSARDSRRHEVEATLAFVSAQWAVLRDFQKRRMPDKRRLTLPMATRWLEMTAEAGATGIFRFDGKPVSVASLDISESLAEDIGTWNRDFETRLKTEHAETDAAGWIADHDSQGRQLADRLRRELRMPHAWTVRFIPLGGDDSGRSIPVCHSRHYQAFLEESVRIEGWRFGISPADAPPLVGVFDDATLAVAMEAIQSAMIRREKLHTGDLSKTCWVHGQDVLQQYILAQTAVVLAWSEEARWQAPKERKHLYPRKDVQVTRRLDVNVDNSSSCLWDWQGMMVEREDVPLSARTRRRLDAWLDLFERAKTWDSEDRRPFKLNDAMFDRWGLAIARAIAHELPGWRVSYRGATLDSKNSGNRA